MSSSLKKAISIGLAALLITNVGFWISLSSSSTGNQCIIQAQPTVALGFFAKSNDNLPALFAQHFQTECHFIPQKAFLDRKPTDHWTTKKVFSESQLSPHLACRVLRI